MIKHTQTIRRQKDELFECVLPFCGVGAERVKYASDSFVTWNILEFFDKIPSNCFVQVFYLGKYSNLGGYKNNKHGDKI